MGLSNFPGPAEGMLPLLVMNSVLSVALLKNMVRSVLQVVGASGDSSNVAEDSSNEASETTNTPRRRRRRISITRYESLCKSRFHNASSSSGIGGETCSTSNGTSTSANNMSTLMECCVCLCRFEANEEVSELSCKHFFHKGCLEKWLDNQHSTCPLCRSLL